MTNTIINSIIYKSDFFNITMSEPLYRVLTLQTDGWDPLTEGITKEQCDAKIKECLDDAVSPDRIKVERVS